MTSSTPSTALRWATLDQFTALLKNTKPGQEVTIDFRRKNELPGIAQITLGKNKDRDQGVLGIGWTLRAPSAVDFHLANVGGFGRD